MDHKTPMIVVQANGSPVNGLFYQRLKSCTLTDQSGQKSDSAEFVFDDRGGTIPLPSEGDILQPFFGYRETGVTTMGQYVVDGWGYGLSQSGGEELTLSCKAADLTEIQKEKASEHFDNQTLGSILQKVFGRVGTQIVVDPELAGIQIEYLVRHDQSSLDFATRLADQYNAVFKSGGGKMLFVKRGNQAMAGGGSMAPLILTKSMVFGVNFQGKPRPKYNRVVAKWHDPDTGKTLFETAETGGKGPMRALKHVFRTQEEAKQAAGSEATHQNRASSEGSFEMEGLVSATAEQDVIAVDFRDGVSGRWRADKVDHTFQSGSGGKFTTSVAVKAPEKQVG